MHSRGTRHLNHELTPPVARLDLATAALLLSELGNSARLRIAFDEIEALFVYLTEDCCVDEGSSPKLEA